MCVPGLASNKNLAGVHDTAGQAGSVDGAQGRTELDDVGPDQRLGEQTCVLPWRGRFMLSCIHTQTHVLSHTHTHRGRLGNVTESTFSRQEKRHGCYE